MGHRVNTNNSTELLFLSVRMNSALSWQEQERYALRSSLGEETGGKEDERVSKALAIALILVIAFFKLGTVI